MLTQYFWPESFRINEVVSSLVKKGLQVNVLTGKPNYPQGAVFEGYKAWGMQRETYCGAGVYRIPLAPRRKSGVGLAINYLSFVLSGLLLAPWALRGHRQDVIFVYAPSPILQAIPAIFLGWLTNSPVILWVQDLWPASLSATGHVKNPAILRAVGRLVSWIYRKVDLLLVQSEAFVEPVRTLAGDTPIQYFPNSVDSSFSAPAAHGAELLGLDADFPVLFAGNIGTAQAVDVIVDAAERLQQHPEIQFVVVGDGSRRLGMMEAGRKRGLTNLHLPGRFPVESMPGFMQRAAVLLVTLADQEVFAYTVPSKVQAYLAAGRPIIASINGEGARVVTDAGAGLAVPAEDGSALAEAVMKLYRMNSEERAALGRNGARYFAEHFEHEMLVDRLQDIFSEVLARRKEKTK